MEQLYTRIDNRLLHGQVVQYWIPRLKVNRLLVADDAVAGNSALPIVYRMAVPDRVAVDIARVVDLPRALAASPEVVTMVLLADVFDLVRAIGAGFRCPTVTLGNVHASPDRERITDAVFLSRDEQAALALLTTRGVQVRIETLPRERWELVGAEREEARWLHH